MKAMKEYRYYLSSGVGSNVKMKISMIELAPICECTDTKDILENISTKANEQELNNNKKLPHSVFDCHGLNQLTGTPSELRNSSLSELFMTAQLFADGLPMHPMPICSKGPTKCSETSIYWNEWVSFPIKYRDLSRNSVLALTIWGVGGVPVGGTTISLFTKEGILRDGLQCLRLWKNVAADPSSMTTTPAEMDEEWQKQESYRLDKLREKYDRREMPRNEWMDGVTDRRIARIRRGLEPPGQKEFLSPFSNYRQDACLWLEMPYYGYPVVYEEEPYPQKNWTPYTSELPKRMPLTVDNTTTSPSLPPSSTTASNRSSSEAITGNLSKLILVWDPDLNEENPSEKKYRKLARDILRGSIDPNLKPSRDEKASIEALLAQPTDLLRNEDKDLLWKFRYTLTDNKKAVVKFVLSVDWNDEQEVKQASDLLQQWCEIDIADALKLLGRQKEFKQDIVRNFAVSTLARAKNEDLLDFLLQLVQALRYDKTIPSTATAAARSMSGDDDTTSAASTAALQDDDHSSTSGSCPIGPLARFLIYRSTTNFQMANYFYWYLKVEAGDHADGEMYRAVLTQMLDEMKQDEEKKLFYEMIMAQDEFMVRLLTCHSKAREEKGKKDQKEEKLRHFLKQFPWPKGMIIRLPLDPQIHLSGLVPSAAKMFKSAMYPAVIQFQTIMAPSNDNLAIATQQIKNTSSSHEEGEMLEASFSSALAHESLSTRMIHYLNRDGNNKEGPMYKVMVKNGDDLRQDQLIMQMFILMDRLLKKVNLDLKLTPYRILATGPADGLMEFVTDSFPVSYVVANFESPQVLSFLRKYNPDPNGDYGVSPEALSNYVKSVAGYCVLTYLLGIGDRHLDNLMMKSQGHLFHIDFGFIFGADPKLYPPPFKLTKEMVEGMGGPESEHYLRFKTYCCQAYNWLRKSADLILNLLSLMVDAGIEELSTDPVTTLQKVQEKFRLDLTDEQAEQFFLGLINDSVTALFPVLMEYIHKVATKLR